MLTVRILFILSVFFFLGNTAMAQDAGISYFELNVDPTGDSSQHNIYFMLAVDGNAQVSTIGIDVKGADGQTVATVPSLGIAALKSTYPYRVENNVLYLTIETGAHAPSPYYQATAVLTPLNGEPLEYTRTKQM